MNNGISRYDASRINPYRQFEKSADAPVGRPDTPSRNAEAASQRPALGPDLSDAEARMIDQYFPESQQMKMRLYGPGSQTRTVNPTGVGRRVDLLG